MLLHSRSREGPSTSTAARAYCVASKRQRHLDGTATVARQRSVTTLRCVAMATVGFQQSFSLLRQRSMRMERCSTQRSASRRNRALLQRGTLSPARQSPHANRRTRPDSRGRWTPCGTGPGKPLACATCRTDSASVRTAAKQQQQQLQSSKHTSQVQLKRTYRAD